MLNRLNITIDFAQSKIYRRLSLVIYGFALMMLLASAFIVVAKIIIGSFLLFQLIWLSKKPLPYARYSSLSYARETWRLDTKTNQQYFFDRARVILATPLFFLLELKSSNQAGLCLNKKNLVIFFDQLSAHSYRSLRVIEKIQ